jgi:hypothetical protein
MAGRAALARAAQAQTPLQRVQHLRRAASPGQQEEQPVPAGAPRSSGGARQSEAALAGAVRALAGAQAEARGGAMQEQEQEQEGDEVDLTVEDVDELEVVDLT